MKFVKCFEEFDGHYIPLFIRHLISIYKEEGYSVKNINLGACMEFAEDLKTLMDEDNIEGEILNDGLFYDVFDDTPEEELAKPEEYNSKTPENFGEVGLPSHYWVYSNEKHYDSEKPDGVDDMFELPTIKRFYEKYTKK